MTSRSRTFAIGTTPQTFTAVFENRLPTARVTASATTGGAPLQVSFDGRASSDTEGEQLRYAWSDGKGNTSTAAA